MNGLRRFIAFAGRAVQLRKGYLFAGALLLFAAGVAIGAAGVIRDRPRPHTKLGLWMWERVASCEALIPGLEEDGLIERSGRHYQHCEKQLAYLAGHWPAGFCEEHTELSVCSAAVRLPPQTVVPNVEPAAPRAEP